MNSHIKIPEGLELMPFQWEGVGWILDKFSKGQKSILLGDQMGVGKTIQAIATLNSMKWTNTLVIVPASLKYNWKREMEKWLVEKKTIGMVMDGKTMPSGDIIICNYDILAKHPAILGRHWDVMILDECHMIKNRTAKRSRATLAIKSEYLLALTGTPILNRPSELFNIAHRCAPKVFPDWWHYAKRYCDLQDTRFGLDFSGASNLDELQAKLKNTIMLRRLKRDVLKDLPEKRRQIIELPPTKEMRVFIDRENREWKLHEETLAKLAARRDMAAVSENEEEYQAAAATLKKCYKVAFESIARVRKETALAKLPLVVAHTKDVLESTKKVVVFAHHKEVVANLMKELATFHPVQLVGDDDIGDRQAAVDKFQNDPNCRVFVGSIRAAGVGITLTAASTVLFAETDWTPALVCQAEDRCHRHGQMDSVLIQHLALESSLDAKMIKTIMEKQLVIDAALDDSAAKSRKPSLATAPKTASTYIDVGRTIAADQREALLKGLRILCKLDGDHARQCNGEGFSAFHTEIGHELAQKHTLTDAQAGFASYLINRYRRQLDVGVLRAAGITITR